MRQVLVRVKTQAEISVTNPPAFEVGAIPCLNERVRERAQSRTYNLELELDEYQIESIDAKFSDAIKCAIQHAFSEMHGREFTSEIAVIIRNLLSQEV